MFGLGRIDAAREALVTLMRKRRSFVVPVFLLVVVAAMLILDGATASEDVPRYAVETSLSAVDGAERAFRCDVTISDLATGEVLSKPRLFSTWGEVAVMEQSGRDHAQIKIETLVSESGDTASIDVELIDEGRVVARHQMTVELGR